MDINYDFSKHSQILAVYLFGSRAEKNADDNSDVDIAVVTTETFSMANDWNLLLEMASYLEGSLKCKVDLLLYHKCDPLFQKEIRTKGKLLYYRDWSKLKKILFIKQKIILN